MIASRTAVAKHLPHIALTPNAKHYAAMSTYKVIFAIIEITVNNIEITEQLRRLKDYLKANQRCYILMPREAS